MSDMSRRLFFAAVALRLSEADVFVLDVNQRMIAGDGFYSGRSDPGVDMCVKFGHL
jgi:hypothetical protein